MKNPVRDKSADRNEKINRGGIYGFPQKHIEIISLGIDGLIYGLHARSGNSGVSFRVCRSKQ